MALSTDLTITARQLVHVYQRRPRQADLRRLISTAYYAECHGFAEVAASRLIGTSRGAQKTPALSRVYRALNYQTIKKASGYNEAKIIPTILLFLSLCFQGFGSGGIRPITTRSFVSSKEKL